jgi:protein transport protein SEC61 subunit gamma-like protein
MNPFQLDYSVAEQENKGDHLMVSIRGFIGQSRRILSLAKKPSRHEVWLTTKVSLLGVILIGALAFVIHLVFIVIGFHP